jgi:TonB-linked SusC/RagA family outer membrane protein
MKETSLFCSDFPDFRFKLLMKLCTLILLISFAAAAFSPLQAQQQTREISGTVTDSKGQPVIGASVAVPGTTIGVNTDDNGVFRLSVPANIKTISVSFIGMKQQEVDIADKTTVIIQMLDDTVGLSEVVVIGYGTQKKSDITGTVASLNQERLKKIVVSDITQVLQGALAGVFINQNNGGAVPTDQTILIRGRNSITASTSPLIVVDGVSYSGLLTDINPNDIKSLEVLKDASSAAIYGSRGSNGVILITTKGGEEGKTSISYDGYYSIQNYTNIPHMMNGEQFYQLKLLYAPQSIFQSEIDVHEKNPKGTDYYKLSMRQGSSQNHNISASGGTKNMSYFISGNAVETKGLAKNDNYLKISTRINVEGKVTDWLTLGTRTSLAYIDQSGASSTFRNAFQMNPLTNPFKDDGTIAIFPWPENQDYTGPLSPLLYDDSDLSSQVITNNFVNVNIPFIKGLQYKISTGYKLNNSNHYQYQGRNTPQGYKVQGYMTGDNEKSYLLSVDNILTYDREFGKHHLFLTGLYSFEETASNSFHISAQGFPNDVLTYYGIAQALYKYPELDFSKTDLISEMFRANYAYADRYLFTFTIRRDGYSAFGAQEKYGSFPSFAFGWNIANENFFPLKDIINTLKLRASWGKNGNQAISAFSTVSRLGQADNVAGSTNVSGYFPSVLGQDDLGWETTASTNIGLDFGILENRITGEINHYIANTSDLLLARSISPVSGFESITQNIGKTNNKGLEISISSKNINMSSFTWITEGNISFVKNKIVALYGLRDADGKLTDDLANNWFIGHPINVNYDFVFDGVWQLDEADVAASYGYQPGYAKLKDFNKDGVISSGSDRKIIGQVDPKFTWGLTNNFSYKNFTLSVFIYGVNGVTKRNLLRFDNVGKDARLNDVVKDWWTPTNPSNTMTSPCYESSRIPFQYFIYEDASFARLKELALSYDLPAKWLDQIKLKRLRIYFSGRNLITLTKFGGIDPEFSTGTPGSGGAPAIISNTPLQKEYTFGLNIGL